MASGSDRWLYGMRPAAIAWTHDYLGTIGFRRGEAAQNVFFCEEGGARCVAHGGDFTLTGEKLHLTYIKKKIQRHHDLNVRTILGDCEEDDREMTLLNRRLRRSVGGLQHEADSKHPGGP